MPSKDKVSNRVAPSVKFSKAEDALIRAWLMEQHSIRMPQLSFWKLTETQAIEKVKANHPGAEIEAGDLMNAARKLL